MVSTKEFTAICNNFIALSLLFYYKFRDYFKSIMSNSNGANVSSRAFKRSRPDFNDQMDVRIIGSGSDITMTGQSGDPDRRSKIQKMCSIHPHCNNIGGIYNMHTTNVTFLCITNGDDVQIPAHKSILAADSTVFYRQFYVESRKLNTIRMGNIDGNIFCKFLTSFYSKSMKMQRNDVPELMRLAYDYDAGKCKQICQKFLHKSLDTGVDDVLWILDMALNHNCTAIRDRCIEKILQYGDILIGTDEFLQCKNRNVLKVIVSNDYLRRNEMELFAACVRWAKQRIGHKKTGIRKAIRREIGKCFEMINFQSMDANQFVECLSKFAPIFRTREIYDISKVIFARRQSVHPSNVDFNESKRSGGGGGMPKGKLLNMRYTFENHLANFRTLYNDNNSADMHFVFNSHGGVRFAAHKCILAIKIKSPLLQQLNEMNGAGEIRVNSVGPRKFAAFLKLLYGYDVGEIAKQAADLETILALAYEYHVPDIFKGQEIQLKQFITIETVFWAANLRRKYRFIDSMQFDCKRIQRYANVKTLDFNLAFHAMALVHCSRTIVERAVGIKYRNRNVLCIVEAVINWAKNRCEQSSTNEPAINIQNIRKTMKNILMLIPFHKMTQSQFDTFQNNYPGLLNETEIQAVLTKMMTEQKRTK